MFTSVYDGFAWYVYLNGWFCPLGYKTVMVMTYVFRGRSCLTVLTVKTCLPKKLAKQTLFTCQRAYERQYLNFPKPITRLSSTYSLHMPRKFLFRRGSTYRFSKPMPRWCSRGTNVTQYRQILKRKQKMPELIISALGKQREAGPWEPLASQPSQQEFS